MSHQHRAHNENTERYYVTYGCERDPFSDDGISGLFFPGGDRKKTVEELLHFARFTRSPLLVLGKAGAGKSTVFRQLSVDVDKDTEFAHVDVEIMQSERQLLEIILRAFRQTISSDGSLFQQLSQWIDGQSARQRYVILCLDNAHNLSAEFLQQFFDLTDKPDSLFRLALAGEPQVQPVLESLADQYEFTLNTIELQPYSEANVREYAAYRLRASGYDGDFPFTDIQIKAAQRRSNGNIHQLNLLLRDMLIAGSDYRKRINFKFPMINLVAASGIVLIILFIALGGDTDQEQPKQQLPLTLNGGDAGSIGLVEAISNGNKTPTKGAQTGVLDSEVSEAVVGAGADKSHVSPTASDSELVKKENRNEILPEKPLASGSLADKPVNIALAAKRGKKADTAAVDQPSSELKQAAEEAVESTADPAVVRTKQAVDQVAGDTASTQDAVRKRLQSWSETGYALQIFGTHNEQRAHKLVAQYFGQADLLFYETLHNGKSWFVVINGPYTGRQAAQQSISSLPESLRRLRPWPRNIASIKGDIERYHRIVEASR